MADDIRSWPPFFCSVCHGTLDVSGPALVCARHGERLRQAAGIWRPVVQDGDLTGDTEDQERFLDGYRRVRLAEGWSHPDPAYVRALPFRDLSGCHEAIWRIRAASFLALGKWLEAMAQALGRPLEVLDLGAGNGWLSLRLASAGYRVAAIDLSDDRGDGLGASAQLPEAEDIAFLEGGFDHLPFAAESFDVAIFNGSFHYSTAASRTLAETGRVLRPGGLMVIVDSPVYRRESSGLGMLEERRDSWAESYDFEIPESSAVGFLTRQRLVRWSVDLDFNWRFEPLALGLRWRLKPWLLPLIGRREPARFPLILGERLSGLSAQSRDDR